MQATDIELEFRGVSAYYGTRQVLREVNFGVPRHSIFGVIGPANSGKTTLLKAINQTLEFVAGARLTGQVLLNGQVVATVRDPTTLRRRIGMVFPLPVDLPLTIRPVDSHSASTPTAGPAKVGADSDAPRRPAPTSSDRDLLFTRAALWGASPRATSLECPRPFSWWTMSRKCSSW